MSEQTPQPQPMIKVIRIETPTCTIAMVTKPTTIPAEILETNALREHPSGKLKPTRIYHPEVFALLEDLAEERGLSIDEVIDRREAAEADQQ